MNSIPKNILISIYNCRASHIGRYCTSMTEDQKGKVALVTGASRGIGRAISVALAREGFTLALWGRSKKELAATQSICEREGAMAYEFVCDLANVRKVEKAFKQTVKSAGQVDLLINNAGIGFRKLLEKTRPKDWDQMMAVNMRAPYLLMRLALPRMKKAKSGQIINIGSGASNNGIPELSAYCASKFGLLGLTVAAGFEARKYGVKVQSVLPGSTNTEFMGKRIQRKSFRLRPEDVAELVMFLVRQDGQAWTNEANLRPLVL